MLDAKKKEAFRVWLSKNTDFSNRVVQDTLSRLSRIGDFAALDSNLSEHEYIFQLSEKAEFKSLSPTVKSQLKRAYKLYRSFNSTQKN